MGIDGIYELELLEGVVSESKEEIRVKACIGKCIPFLLSNGASGGLVGSNSTEELDKRLLANFLAFRVVPN
jgi:hypothetical protein